MARASQLLVAAALVCAAALQTQAHGGGLHDWDWNSPDYANYTRIHLASAANFTFYDAETASSFLPGYIPFFPTYTPAATVTGNITIWEYLDTTCHETAALQVNMNITAANKRPVAGEKVYVYTMTGKCATGVQGVYIHNLTAADNRLNLLWAAREDFTNENGTLWGTAPNLFFPRANTTAAGPALQSVLLAFAPNVSPFLCADVKWLTWDAAAWAWKVKDCVPSGAGRRKSLRHILKQ